MWYSEVEKLCRHELGHLAAGGEVLEAKALVTFMNLKKAYDFVPREALWMSLDKMGVPEEPIHLIKSLHQAIKAKICMEGKIVGNVRVQNGIRQGCCMPSVLFNLYICLEVERWLGRVDGAEGIGITIKYKVDE